MGHFAWLYVMPANRRLEDRIRELCSRLSKAQNGEFARVLDELQAAMHEHALRIHNRTSATVLAWPETPRDRRKA